MASSNRHWPSLFKSKPSCNNQQWQQHPHDINPNCARSSNSSSPFSSGCEERSPEPKPRWNPKPEQIRILEAIFNSGMVNPPRDEIRRIRAQLQEYGQVGDANVFYWFQNRKSRSKHKQRSKTAATAAAASIQRALPPMSASSSSSTNSSEKASPKKPRGGAAAVAVADTNNSTSNNNSNVVVDQFGINNSPTSVNQCCSYFHSNSDQFVGQEPVFFPLQQSGASVLGGGAGGYGQGLGLGFTHDPMGNNGVSAGPMPEHGVLIGGGGGFSNLLLGEMIGGGGEPKREEVEKLKFQQELSFLVTNPPNTTCTLPTSAPNAIPTPNSSGVISSNLGQILGVGEAGGMAGKSTVFIDNVAIDVPAGLYNVKETFGEDAILVYPSGHPIITNEWGVTLHPLQNGACYYVVRTTVAASPLLDKLNTTPDLLAPDFPYQM